MPPSAAWLRYKDNSTEEGSETFTELYDPSKGVRIAVEYLKSGKERLSVSDQERQHS
jgi:hypothetical protein